MFIPTALERLIIKPYFQTNPEVFTLIDSKLVFDSLDPAFSEEL